MSIVVVAISAPFMGHIVDMSSMRTGFVVPLACFVGVGLYAAMWQVLESKDAKSVGQKKKSGGCAYPGALNAVIATSGTALNARLTGE
jgi:hypothetical protein